MLRRSRPDCSPPPLVNKLGPTPRLHRPSPKTPPTSTRDMVINSNDQSLSVGRLPTPNPSASTSELVETTSDRQEGGAARIRHPHRLWRSFGAAKRHPALSKARIHLSQLAAAVSKTAASVKGSPNAFGRARLYPASKLSVTSTLASSNGQVVEGSNHPTAATPQVTTSPSTMATGNSWAVTATSSTSTQSTSESKAPISATSDLHPCTLERACGGGFQSPSRPDPKLPSTVMPATSSLGSGAP